MWRFLGSATISREWVQFPPDREGRSFYRLTPSPSLNLLRVGRGWVYHRFRLFDSVNSALIGVSQTSRFWLEKEPQLLGAKGLLTPFRSLEAFFLPYRRTEAIGLVRFKVESWVTPTPPASVILSPTKTTTHEQHLVPPLKGEEPALATGYLPLLHSGGLLVNASSNTCWVYLAKSTPSRTTVVDRGLRLNQNGGQFSIPEGCSDSVYLATSSSNPVPVFAIYYARQ